MDGSKPRRRGALSRPGLKALEASGDGFWELDLTSGTAWFSAWFYQKLGWTPSTKRPTFSHLEPLFEPGAWALLMGCMRAHLEGSQPLDLELEVTLPPAAAGSRGRWHIRGAALRNGAGQPLFLSGVMREVPAAADAGLKCLADAFEALPVAAALLDARAGLVRGNRLWGMMPTATAELALARLRAANSQTAIEFWLDEGTGGEAQPRRLRVRALAFQYAGARHLTVTVEDRRSD